MKNETETINKNKTSGIGFCRRCGIQFYSDGLYCKECFKILTCQHKWKLRYWMRFGEPIYFWQCEKCGEIKSDSGYFTF